MGTGWVFSLPSLWKKRRRSCARPDSPFDLAQGRRGRLSPRWVRHGWRLVGFLVVKFTMLQAVIFGGQNSIELFDESEEFWPVFFYRDKRAELMNAITVGFVHKGA